MDWIAQNERRQFQKIKYGPHMNNGNRERLKTPLIRENGKHRAASWEEALDRVAAGFRTQVERHGPRAFEPQSRITSVSSISRYELVPPPAPNTVARPATLGACQVRLQLSMLFVPITERTNLCAT